MDTEIENLISADSSNWATALTAFIEKASKIFTFPELANDYNKRQNVWNAVCNIVKTSQDVSVIRNCFVVTKILSREKYYLNQLVNEELLNLMKKHAGFENGFDYNENTTSIGVEVRNSFSNMLINSREVAEKIRTSSIFEGVKKRTVDYKNKSIPRDFRYLDVKLLFLCTALCPSSREEQSDMLDPLIGMLQEILKEAAENQSSKENLPAIHLNDKQTELVNEILKALFNITVKTDGSDAELKASHVTLVEVLREYLFISSTDLDKTWEMRDNVINQLTNMPDESYTALLLPLRDGHEVPSHLAFEKYNMTAIFEILMFLQAKLNSKPSASSQNEVLSPTVIVLLKGAKRHRPIRKFLKNEILPPLKDVHTKPEQGNTIRNQLVRMLTSPITQVRKLVGDLLFVLCKQSVTKMTKYTGYGNAAGFFADKGIMMGLSSANKEEDYSEDSGNSETEEYAEHKHGINPVIGCYEAPHAHPMQNMTEEQKEYETMRLVNMMDRLMNTGIVKPCRIGEDGKPEPIKHVLELQENLGPKIINNNSS